MPTRSKGTLKELFYLEMKIPSSFMLWLLKDTGKMLLVKYLMKMVGWFLITLRKVPSFTKNSKGDLLYLLISLCNSICKTLSQPCHDLEALCDPFSIEEIDAFILDLPNDKSPGPDGFNNLFFKKAWPIIKYDVYRLCNDFYWHQADIKSINSSYITLVPKKDNPKTVNDFRPISLLNSSPKILANRLQRKILQVIHENQYGFIKGRTIQDCLG